MSHGNIAHELANMRPAKASTLVTAKVEPIFTSEDGILFCYGSGSATVCEEETRTIAPGCIYIKVSAAATSFVYKNSGTSAAVTMVAISS